MATMMMLNIIGLILILTITIVPGPATCQRLPPSIQLRKWAQPIVKPPVIAPVCCCGGADQYEITISQIQHRLHPDLNLTTMYAYGGTYPGPTIEARAYKPVEVIWRNQLPEQHILPTEPLVHGGMMVPPDSAHVTHLHGAHVEAKSDGDPMTWVPGGQEHHYYYSNDQLATTLWYHDHVMSRTRVNVYSGLAGFYLLRDEHEDDIGLPSDEYEMPMLIQDRIIRNDSQLFYPFTWGAFEGDTPVINGRVYPYYEVKPRAYRFRILNGCNTRFLTLSIPEGPTIWQIGSDGGFLDKPVQVQNITLGPSERVDVVVDFRGYDGKSLILANSGPVPFPGGVVAESFKEILQFRVADTGRSCKPFQLPSLQKVGEVPPLPKLDELPPNSIAMERFLTLEGLLVTEGNRTSFMFLLNRLQFHDPPTETPLVDTVELWHLLNLTPLTHPIHIHLTQFRILQRRPFAGPFIAGQPINFTGPAIIPSEAEQGWKDTAQAPPGHVTTLWVPFTRYTGTYVWHCHMLEHEDHDMMRPLVVRPRCEGDDCPEDPPGGHDM